MAWRIVPPAMGKQVKFFATMAVVAIVAIAIAKRLPVISQWL